MEIDNRDSLYIRLYIALICEYIEAILRPKVIEHSLIRRDTSFLSDLHPYPRSGLFYRIHRRSLENFEGHNEVPLSSHRSEKDVDPNARAQDSVFLTNTPVNVESI